jgi:protein TonB
VLDGYAIEARVVQEVKADFPDEARRLGVDGKVTLRVGIDRTGKVRTVRAISKLGYGLEDAAVKALWRFRFSPARLADGSPVDVVITYLYRFEAR